MKKLNEITTLYKCKSQGTRNNGLLKSCDFQFEFRDGFQPHCPQCGEKMQIVPRGRSVGDILRYGYNLQVKKEDK